MNPDSVLRRVLRRGAPVAAAAVLGAGAGAGVYAVTSGGGSGGTGSTAAVPTAIVPAQSASATQTAESLTQLYKKATPGIVDITVSTGANSGGGFGSPGGGQQAQAEGSGFVVDSAGHIVTNEHVVSGATSIQVHFQTGKTVKATLVGSDPSTDIAVIKVSVPASELHPLAWGNSATVLPGQEVVAIGSPFGLPESMTAGIVSAVNRTITAPNNYSISGAIQTDAAINHGNSGGPLIDIATGQVIGVNAQIESDSGGNDGVGFAIPANAAKSVASTLIAGRTVQHAYLGVGITDAPNGGGAQITRVVSGSPADTAGLQAGDVITAVNGSAIASADNLSAAIDGHKPGDKVTLTIDRNGATKSIAVTLGTRPS